MPTGLHPPALRVHAGILRCNMLDRAVSFAQHSFIYSY